MGAEAERWRSLGAVMTPEASQLPDMLFGTPGPGEGPHTQDFHLLGRFLGRQG